MRRLIWIVAFAAFETFGSVEIPSARVESLVKQRVYEQCGGASSEACTRFRDVALLCECVQEKGGWRLHASARAVPFIYLSSVTWLAHEKLHIWDFQYYLRAHTAALRKPLFATEKACDELSRAATAAFPETMQRIARLSAARRDGTSNPSSEDHLVVVKAEVMPKLVDHRLADLANDIAPVARNAKNGTAKDGNLVRQRGEHVKAAFRQGNTAVDSEQLVVVRSFAQSVAVFLGRLFFDDDDHVVQEPRKLVGQLFESLFHELLELRIV